ncbi:MAG: hypothetical protein KOO60_11675 [Gemmatimonadales bacterium]|nr:hypothetical protein [Gemmatimonadales bacterium]
MIRSWNSRKIVAAIALLCIVCLSAKHVMATEEDMAELAVIIPHLCAACHVLEDPSSGNSVLNAFGLDFLENGRIWDTDLAQLDSDGDGCLNGVELGDSDGDGVADGNVTQQAGNPGVQDGCGSGSLVDERTWDALKAMFDR